ncbi:DnaJ-domain-containing protein [Leucogyrophana mollusca]|uniref:DnaJ-domain-containing protein n=1 Tax=Leucogyrophana mollusca TaxID=85980 RepID=A0ACB8BJR7_9AGAM|nr:DnaJ-domain-containing protein [Leucogyrophana mollusca]
MATAAERMSHYEVLGLTSEDANDDTIRAAYKKLALQWHPDRHVEGKEHAAQMFIKVNTAYHALMDGRESTHSASAEAAKSPSSAETTQGRASSEKAEAPHPPSPTNRSTPDREKKPSTSKPSSSPPTPSETQSPSSPPSETVPPSHKTSHRSSHERGSRPRRDHPPHHPPGVDSHSMHSSQKSETRSSRSRDHLRDPPKSSSHHKASSSKGPSHSSEVPGSTDSRQAPVEAGSKASPRSGAPSDIPPSSRGPRDSEGSRPSHNRPGLSHFSKPVIPPVSSRLHKLSRLGLGDEFVQRLSKGTTKGRKTSDAAHLPSHDDIPTFGSPLRPLTAPRGTSKEWLFPLPLTLDEMYHGTNYSFRVTRELLSRKKKQVDIEIDIPPGMRSGTRIVCPGTGHERKDGTIQDVVFLVEEVTDDRFSRVKDDLYMDVCVPWVDSLVDQGGDLCIEGLDGEKITFALPYPIYDKATEGQVIIKGAGMPVCEGRKTVGRGDLIVRWQVVFENTSKWQTFKKVLRIKV